MKFHFSALITLLTFVGCSDSGQQRKYESTRALDSDLLNQGSDFELISISSIFDEDNSMNLVRNTISSFIVQTSGSDDCWADGNKIITVAHNEKLKLYRYASNCKLSVLGFRMTLEGPMAHTDMVLQDPIDAMTRNSQSDFSGPGFQGRATVRSALRTKSNSSLQVALSLFESDQDETSVLFSGCSNDKAHGDTESRERFKDSFVNEPAVCVSEPQTRTCFMGVWSEWSGSFNKSVCQIIPKPTPRPTLPPVVDTPTNSSPGTSAGTSPGTPAGGGAPGTPGGTAPSSPTGPAKVCKVFGRSPVNGDGTICGDACIQQLTEAAVSIGYPVPFSKGVYDRGGKGNKEAAKAVYWDIRTKGQQQGCDPLAGTVYRD